MREQDEGGQGHQSLASQCSGTASPPFSLYPAQQRERERERELSF